MVSSNSTNKLKEKYYEHRYSSNPIFTSYSFSGDLFGHAARASEQSSLRIAENLLGRERHAVLDALPYCCARLSSFVRAPSLRAAASQA